MASRKLKKHWERVRISLNRAASFIPEATKGSEHYRECVLYLEHNELELACDMLEETARNIGLIEPELWRSLRDACVSMELYEKAAFCAGIARGGLEVNDRY